MKILELFDFSESKVSGNIISNVKVLGLISKNKREYLESAVREATSKYEGIDVYINHSLSSRKVEDKIGLLSGVNFVENADKARAGLFAKSLILNPKHAETSKLLWWAENHPTKVGLSHDISGSMNKDNQIEKISEVHSVDIVAQPATTNGFHESVDSASEKDIDSSKIHGYLAFITEQLIQSKKDKEEEMDYSKITIEDLTKNRKDLVDAIEKPLKEAIAKQPEAVTAAVNAAVAKQKAVQEALAKVPEKARTAVFTEQLEAVAGDAKKLEALVEDRNLAFKAPKSGTGASTRSTEEVEEKGEEEDDSTKLNKKLESAFAAAGVKSNKAKE